MVPPARSPSSLPSHARAAQARWRRGHGGRGGAALGGADAPWRRPRGGAGAGPGRAEGAEGLFVVLGAGLAAASHPLLYVKLLVQVGHEPLPPTIGRNVLGKKVLYLPGFFTYGWLYPAQPVAGHPCPRIAIPETPEVGPDPGEASTRIA